MDDTLLEKYGFKTSDLSVWKAKLKSLKDNASRRGLSMTLSLRQYLRLAKRAGIVDPSQIGCTAGSYQMARKGDTGNYEWGNCRFLTREANIAEMRVNGGFQSMIRSKTGRTKETDNSVLRQSKKISGRTAETHSGVATTTQKISKNFSIKDPAGKKYVGRNLAKFCRENNLSKVSMGFVLRGEKTDNYGWTGKWTT